MQKFLDFIYVLIFGRRTLDGFVNNKRSEERRVGKECYS